MHSLEVCRDLMARYVSHNGHARTIQEGVLGLGLVICYGPGLKTTIIREVYLNEGSSGHTITLYNRTPKKYLKYVDPVTEAIAAGLRQTQELINENNENNK